MVSLSVFKTRLMLRNNLINIKKKFLALTDIQSPYQNKEAPLCNLRSKASYTVEAAFILPISLLMIVFFLYFFRVLYVQWGVDYTLNKTAREHAAVISNQDTDTGLIIK